MSRQTWLSCRIYMIPQCSRRFNRLSSQVKYTQLDRPFTGYLAEMIHSQKQFVKLARCPAFMCNMHPIKHVNVEPPALMLTRQNNFFLSPTPHRTQHWFIIEWKLNILPSLLFLGLARSCATMKVLWEGRGGNLENVSSAASSACFYSVRKSPKMMWSPICCVRM